MKKMRCIVERFNCVNFLGECFVFFRGVFVCVVLRVLIFDVDDFFYVCFGGVLFEKYISFLKVVIVCDLDCN